MGFPGYSRRQPHRSRGLLGWLSVACEFVRIFLTSLCFVCQVSLTGKYVLSELGSPGKSGSFFYFSADYRFIIKTIHHDEHKLLRKILPKYHEHLVLNPQTLINRIYGLHRVKLPRGRKIHFVVMANIFPPNKDIHETFDLKV